MNSIENQTNTRVVVTATKQEGDVIAHDTMSVSIKLDDGNIINLQKGIGLYYALDPDAGAMPENGMALVGKRPFPEDGNELDPFENQEEDDKSDTGKKAQKTGGKSAGKKA